MKLPKQWSSRPRDNFALWQTSIQTASGSFVSLRIWFYFSIFNILLGATCPLGASRLKQTAISFPSVLIRVERRSSQNAFYFWGIHDKRRWSNQTAFSLPRAHDKSEDHVKRLTAYQAFITRGETIKSNCHQLFMRSWQEVTIKSNSYWRLAY